MHLHGLMAPLQPQNTSDYFLTYCYCIVIVISTSLDVHMWFLRRVLWYIQSSRLYILAYHEWMCNGSGSGLPYTNELHLQLLNQNMSCPLICHSNCPPNRCAPHFLFTLHVYQLYIPSKIITFSWVDFLLFWLQTKPCPHPFTFRRTSLNDELLCTVWLDLGLFTNVKKNIEWNPLHQKYNLLSLSWKALEIQFLLRRLASGSLRSGIKRD